MPKAWKLCFICGLLLITTSLLAQEDAMVCAVAIPKLVFDIPQAEQLLADDKRLGLDARFAGPIAVDLSPSSAGKWESPNELDWQLRISIPGAKGIYLALDQLDLPPGSEISLLTSNGGLIDQYSEKQLSTKNKVLLFGGTEDELLLKYSLSKPIAEHNHFRIFKLFHVYKSIEKQDIASADAGILNCHLNTFCLEDPLMEQKSKGVVRILRYFEEGLAWCSGALMNNTNQDQKPYILTAYHCVDGLKPDYELWRFDFNRANPDCDGEIMPNFRQELCGAEFRAGRRESDFLLLELEDKIPSTFRPHFLGWNRSDQVPTKTITIHHPQGAPQKMAIDQDAPRLQALPILWSNQVRTPADFHWIVEFDRGTQETGSSGGPLFNEHGEIIGQLHGGNANCQSSKSYFGRLSKSWDFGDKSSNRLDFWLDPNQSGVQKCAAFSPEEERFNLSGKVLNQYGGEMANVQMNLLQEGSASLSCITDENGNYFFSDLAANANYSLRPWLAFQQDGETIIKIKEGKRKATFAAKKVALSTTPISQQAIKKSTFVFDRIYPNQIDVEQMQHSLQRLDFTIIKN